MTTKTFSRRLLTVGLLSLGLWSCGAAPDSDGQLQLKLPKPLREISGLTQSSDGALLAVADEKAHIYRIDMQIPLVERLTKFGDPVEKGDFEGITLVDQELYVVTSKGVLWHKQLQAAAKDYRKYKTGIGSQCEVEGLTAWVEKQLLLILCKEGRNRDTRNQLTVFGWSTAARSLLPEPVFQLSYRSAGLPALSPSGIAFTADRQRLFIVAARQQFFVELNLDGSIARSGPLPFPATHPQTEGVVISAANTLYLADEGGKDRGTVTRYEPSF